MKKLARTLITLAIALAIMPGCTTQPEPELVSIRNKSELYTTCGRYYTDGTIVTADGNVWNYHTDAICANEAVEVVFDDNGTPDNIYDDVILEITALVDIASTKGGEAK